MRKSTRFLRKSMILSLLLFLSSAALFDVSAQTNVPLRRSISPSSPAWFIHIDTWNYPDPQKIIDLIPEDIRPYVVFNISLSISHNTETGQFQVAEYGYEIAKSWLRTCAENRVWAMVQVASGGYHQFSDKDLTQAEEFFRDYPNFLGFNYAEQFWGFDDVDPLSAKWVDRMNHFADLLKLSNKYGGYLVVSWCGNEYGQSINPIGMLKRNPAFAAACRQYAPNYILCDKYTQTGYNHDMESLCLGAYLSGYSGQYGIRYDNSGWTDATGANTKNFTLATGISTHLEHTMLNGATIIDGPEIIWVNCFKGLSDSYTPDGFRRRNWTTFQHFDNVQVDMFRKMLDGTIRIPSRKEVIDRAKYVVINDVAAGSDNDVYCSPQTLFDGLYMMDGESNYQYNKSFFKKSGRYPTIPTVFKLNDLNSDANSFQFKINKSAYPWNSIAAKTTEMNQSFPVQSTGDLFVGRNQNAMVTYNPYRTQKSAKGSIPLKYNTCDSIVLKYPRYSGGVVKEYSNKITFYLSNFEGEYNDKDSPTILTSNVAKKDTIKIYGSLAEPTYTFTKRGIHDVTPSIAKDWTNGVLTLIVSHNGPLDVDVNCSGSATNRLTDFTTASMNAPASPSVYVGPRQYEAECFDYMNINGLVTAGQNQSVRNYTGQGYLKFGLSASSAARDSISVYKKGNYTLEIRYQSPSNISTIGLYVNGTKVATPAFANTGGTWKVYAQTVSLKQGKNEIKLMANNSAPDVMLFDNIVVSPASESTEYDFSNDVATTVAGNPAAQFVTVRSGSAGVVSYTNANAAADNGFKAYSAGATNGTGVADLDLFPSNSVNYSVVWKESAAAAGAKKGVLLRATGNNGACAYAEGMKQGYLFVAINNDDNTVTLKPSLAGASGLTEKTAYTSSFKVASGQSCWYRATAIDNKLIFECSKDSITWEGASATTFSDNSYVQGATELIWGLGSDNYNWVMDNIRYSSPVVSLSRLSIPTKFQYAVGHGASASQTFVVSGQSLIDNIHLQSPDNFEISLSSGSGYSSSLTVQATAGTVASTTVYARLKSGLSIDSYGGDISIVSNGTQANAVSISGSVTPLIVSRTYDFTNDVATNHATTPPALNTAVAPNNGATGGVVSYTDAAGLTSNMLKPYSGGKRSATGAIDLNMFSRKSTDYSVTWKQCLGSTGADRKVGVLLRADTLKMGDDATGYVQGMRQGYLFIVYSKSGGGSEFRIYRSTSANSLDMKAISYVDALTPTAGQPMWYRASVSGVAPAGLKLEYSKDSIAWTTAASFSDPESVAPFRSGATQFVWGLAAGDVNFYVDNITFLGIEDPAGESSAIDKVVSDNLTVVSTEYYTIAGIKVSTSLNNLKGLYIVRYLMSDGSVRSGKIFIK